MKRKTLFITILLHTLLLTAVYILQGVIFPFVRISGLVPLLLPIASTGIALYEGRDIGGVSGLFAGILCDISFNQPVGVFTVFLTISGLIVGTLADTVILRGFVTYFISCASVLVISSFIQVYPFIIRFGEEDYTIPVQSLISTTIQQIIYSLILALPIWFFIQALGKHTDRISPSGRVY